MEAHGRVIREVVPAKDTDAVACDGREDERVHDVLRLHHITYHLVCEQEQHAEHGVSGELACIWR